MALRPGDSLLNGQYQITRLLGRGGFGFVYLAHDRLLGEQVALKELIPTLVGDETVLKRFLAEARATIRLTHERIVRTYNVFSEAGNYYIAMEYMAGGSLEDRLKAQETLPPEEGVRIAAEVCEGLHYAHERGVVHCDLKPANILFTTDAVKGTGTSAKVADFGIAHVSDRLVDRTWHTSLGFVAGTLPYMSPEQAEGVRDDRRIDVYALGALLYRMLTGRSYLEFDQRTTPAAQVENVMRIRTQPVPPPSSQNRRVPAWLDAIVLKALAKQAGDRFASAEELRKALLQPGTASVPAKAAPSISPPTARPAPAPARREERPSLSSRASRFPTWFWFLTGGAVLLGLVIIVVIALLLGDGGGGSPTGAVTMVVVLPDTPTTSPDDGPLATTLPSPLPEPSATPEPAAPTRPPAFYREDFGDPGSGWGTTDENNTQVGYEAGEYRIAVNPTNYMAWGHVSDLDLGDFYIEVDARAIQGPLDNNYGVLVRYQTESSDFYWFQISSDGYYSVDLYQDGEFVSLVSWQSSSAIEPGLGAINRLGISCEGDRFQFLVNGIHLVDVTDASLAQGTIGLAAGTFGEGGVVVSFDNLEVNPLR